MKRGTNLHSNICVLCGGKSLYLVSKRLRDGSRKFQVYQCRICTHTQLLPQPTREEDQIYYGRNQQDKVIGKTISLRTLKLNQSFDTQRHVALITKLLPSRQAKILDIGAGYGFLVEALLEAGYKNVWGLEISRERRRLMKNLSSRLWGMDLIANPLPRKGYDMMTLFHVLEHIADPISYLKTIKSYLGPRGILVCEVPNRDELLLKTSLAYRNFYWIRAHLHYFNKRTLGACFRWAGFKKTKFIYVQRYGLDNLFQWLKDGTPQISQPQFTIMPEYREIENFYKKKMSLQGVSDALLAIGSV